MLTKYHKEVGKGERLAALGEIVMTSLPSLLKGKSYRIRYSDPKMKTHSQLLMDGFDSRISPRRSDVCPNPEEPEGEDEDVQMERRRTADALNSTNFDEVKHAK